MLEGVQKGRQNKGEFDQIDKQPLFHKGPFTFKIKEMWNENWEKKIKGNIDSNFYFILFYL